MARKTPGEREPSGDVPLIMNVRQAAKLLGLSPYTVRKFAREGKIPGRKVGHSWRFSRDALIRWLETPDPFQHRPGRKPKGSVSSTQDEAGKSDCPRGDGTHTSGGMNR